MTAQHGFARDVYTLLRFFFFFFKFLIYSLFFAYLHVLLITLVAHKRPRLVTRIAVQVVRDAVQLYTFFFASCFRNAYFFFPNNNTIWPPIFLLSYHPPSPWVMRVETRTVVRQLRPRCTRVHARAEKRSRHVGVRSVSKPPPRITLSSRNMILYTMYMLLKWIAAFQWIFSVLKKCTLRKHLRSGVLKLYQVELFAQMYTLLWTRNIVGAAQDYKKRSSDFQIRCPEISLSQIRKSAKKRITSSTTLWLNSK